MEDLSYSAFEPTCFGSKSCSDVSIDVHLSQMLVVLGVPDAHSQRLAVGSSATYDRDVLHYRDPEQQAAVST